MKTLLRSYSLLAATFCLAFAVFAMAPVQPATAQTVHVDDDAPAGGDGSSGSPFQTIQEGITSLLPGGGTVLIQPGSYIGPIVVDGSNVIIRGDTIPIYDADGFLTGFNDEVVITIDEPLSDPGPSVGEPEDLIELRGSNNEVHNVVVDTLGMFEGFNSAISAKAEDGNFYTNVMFSHIIVRGEIDTGGFTRKANVLFEYITGLDGGVIGIFPSGNGNVVVNRVDLANWKVAVCYFGLEEFPPEENGPSSITGSVEDSRLSGSDSALRLNGQGGGVNPDAPLTMQVVAQGNTFHDSTYAIRLQPVGDGVFKTESRNLTLQVQDNSYFGISPWQPLSDNDVVVSFRSRGSKNGHFVRDTMIVVEDGDGVFPTDVNVGLPKYGNSYVLEVF